MSYRVSNSDSWKYRIAVNDETIVTDNQCCNDEPVFINANTNLINVVTGATNLPGGVGIYKDKTNKHLNLRSLVGGEDVTIVQSGDTIVISSDAGASIFQQFRVITGNSYSISEIDNGYILLFNYSGSAKAIVNNQSNQIGVNIIKTSSGGTVQVVPTGTSLFIADDQDKIYKQFGGASLFYNDQLNSWYGVGLFGSGTTEVSFPGVTGASNGLTRVNQSIVLGGIVTGDTIVTIDTDKQLTVSGNSLFINVDALDIRTEGTGGEIYSLSSNRDGGTIGIQANHPVNETYGSIYASTGTNLSEVDLILADLQSPFHYVNFQMKRDGITSFDADTVVRFNDARSQTKGIEYGGDYSSGYTLRSLIDQGYAVNSFVNKNLFNAYTGNTIATVFSSDSGAVKAIQGNIDLVGQGQIIVTNGSTILSGVSTNFLDSTTGVGLSYWLNVYFRDSSNNLYKLFLSSVTNNTRATISTVYNEYDLRNGHGTNQGASYNGVSGTYNYYIIRNIAQELFSFSLGNGALSRNFSTAIGGSLAATGQTSFAIGRFNAAHGIQSFAGGNLTRATGSYSMTYGKGTNTGGDKRVLASGQAAINVSENNSSQTAGHGALAANSAILGGINHNIASTASRSAIIGGNSIKVTGGTDIVHLPKVRLGLGTGGALITGNTVNQILTRNPINGEIQIRDASTITGATVSTALFNAFSASTTTQLLLTVTGGTNGLTKKGKRLALGGTLTGNTTLDGGFGFEMGNTTPLSQFRAAATNNIRLTVGTQQLLLNTTAIELKYASGTAYWGFNNTSDINSGAALVWTPNNFATQKSIRIASGTTGMLVTDSQNNRGLVYASGYTFTKRSLPDVHFVTGLTSGLGGVQSISGGTNITVTGTSQVTISAYNPHDCEYTYEESCHFVTGAANVTTGAVCNGWFATSNGTGAGCGTNGDLNGSPENPYGVVAVECGTTNTGRSRLNTGANSFLFGSGTQHDVTFRVALSNLSDATDTYTAIVGFCDTSTGAAQTDGAFFRYTHGTNGGRFQCVNEDNTSENAIDSGVSPTANQFQLFRIVVNAAGTSVQYYINGTLVATNNSNIPTASGRNTALGVGNWKSVGTANRLVYVDYIKHKATRTSPL